MSNNDMEVSGASLTPLMDDSWFSDSVWSYTRLKTFRECPYAFYQKYICGVKEDPRFYTTYGSFVHSLLERYYNGKLTKPQLVTEYYKDFDTEVKGFRPPPATLEKFITQGAEYLQGFESFKWECVAVEKKLKFTFHGIPFVGIVDYLGKDEDGSLVLVDHKSKVLKPKSGKNPPLKRDIEVDEMFRQLYLYSLAVEEEYGAFPSKLVINSFRVQNVIEEPFNEEAYKNALKWVEETIDMIRDTQFFKAVDNAFYCPNICGLTDYCEPYQTHMAKIRGDYAEDQ